MRKIISTSLILFVVITAPGGNAAEQSTQTADGFLSKASFQGLRNQPFVKNVLQGNSSVITAAVATAGAAILKRAASNPTISNAINDFFEARGEKPPAFSAVMNDARVPTTVPHMQQDIQWLPHEWQEWGTQQREKLKDKNLTPHGLLRSASRATMELKDSVEQWKEETAEQWREGRESFHHKLQELAKFKELESTSARLKEWQDGMTQKIENLRFSVARSPLSRQRAEMRTKEEVGAHNKMLLGRLFSVLAGDGWEHVLHKDGVDVYRKRIVDMYQGGEKFYCIKAVGVIDAKAGDIYDLLKDTERVNEYNEECAAVKDIETLNDDTKVTWASSKTYFPFKARDFVTRVHNTKLNDGTYVVMSQSQDMAYKPPEGGEFVRTEVLLSGNVMRPDPSDPNKTQFTTVAHINPGGAADTPLGAQLANRICVHG
eukprot:CAMPEP_0181339794 /NCGR_PEP_ID=MMETSP1101-20121128/29478_1 /TAXON_ID=46948 /ORGANISM="Rhodomonas abbreviata, Strain Caron Lab Isolate" /LENGTH=430 /DNA_ID=CAMNT_0023450851 /DNA_START=207 /DNA_END=1496 /DNA_ORIENTATION=-